jgi:hypothetical protein
MMINPEVREREAGRAELQRGGTSAAGGDEGRTPARGGPEPGDLRGDLRKFVRAHPQGWGHADWLGLLERLRARGHDLSDPDAIGRMLEREHLTAVLKRVGGVSPQRNRAIVERYESIGSLRQVGADDLAASIAMPGDLAERIQGGVRIA